MMESDGVLGPAPPNVTGCELPPALPARGPPTPPTANGSATSTGDGGTDTAASGGAGTAQGSSITTTNSCRCGAGSGLGNCGVDAGDLSSSSVCEGYTEGGVSEDGA
jgi:hypothetical protein